MKDLIILQPCPIGGKYTAEINFGRKLSINVLCSILQNIEIEDLRYSLELGIAKFYFNEKRIRLDKNGNVHISDINDEREAKIWISQVRNIIQKAFV